jgi:hypothetical protein
MVALDALKAATRLYDPSANRNYVGLENQFVLAKIYLKWEKDFISLNKWQGKPKQKGQTIKKREMNNKNTCNPRY